MGTQEEDGERPVPHLAIDGLIAERNQLMLNPITTGDLETACFVAFTSIPPVPAISSHLANRLVAPCVCLSMAERC